MARATEINTLYGVKGITHQPIDGARARVTDLINEGKWLWVAANAINHN